jgi:hypothetical protein
VPPIATHADRVQYRQDIWHLWIDADLGSAEGWWVGWCPLHDRDRHEAGSGEFNFSNGTFRCMAEPRCHNKRGMSVSQLADEIIKRG